MSYEYKELIEQAIIDDDRLLESEEVFKELDEVYAKAEAFDDLMELIINNVTLYKGKSKESKVKVDWDAFSDHKYELVESDDQ